MKRFTKYALVLLLALSLLMLASCTPIDGSTVLVTDPIEWAATDDGSEINGDGKTYTRFQHSYNITLDPLTEYEFYHSVYLPFDSYGTSTLYSYSPTGDVLWAIGDDNSAEIYATKEGVASLSAFLESEPTAFHLMEKTNTRHRAYLDAEDVAAFETLRTSGGAAETVNVKDLEDCPCYKLCVYDENGIVRYDYGAIYEMTGAYYYLNYLVLDNSHFDADGNFSYRSGEVTMTKLEGTHGESVDAFVNEMEYLSYSYTYESVEVDTPVYDRTASIVIFWVGYALLGFAAPIPFLVLGLVLPHSERRGRPKYWYAVAIAAVLWILAACALMLVLIL